MDVVAIRRGIEEFSAEQQTSLSAWILDRIAVYGTSRSSRISGLEEPAAFCSSFAAKPLPWNTLVNESYGYHTERGVESPLLTIGIQ